MKSLVRIAGWRSVGFFVEADRVWLSESFHSFTLLFPFLLSIIVGSLHGGMIPGVFAGTCWFYLGTISIFTSSLLWSLPFYLSNWFTICMLIISNVLSEACLQFTGTGFQLRQLNIFMSRTVEAQAADCGTLFS